METCLPLPAFETILTNLPSMLTPVARVSLRPGRQESVFSRFPLTGDGCLWSWVEKNYEVKPGLLMKEC